MSFLLEETVRTVAFDRKHIALVNIPDPIRFAIHTLLISQIRPMAFRAKAAKDIEQASTILDVCMHQSPDLVKVALSEQWLWKAKWNVIWLTPVERSTCPVNSWR
jgi:hypothetical protein